MAQQKTHALRRQGGRAAQEDGACAGLRTDLRASNLLLARWGKGGGARTPTHDEIQRLRRGAKLFRAKAVVLFEWRLGSAAVFKTLPARRDDWVVVAGKDVFG